MIVEVEPGALLLTEWIEHDELRVQRSPVFASGYVVDVSPGTTTVVVRVEGDDSRIAFATVRLVPGELAEVDLAWEPARLLVLEAAPGDPRTYSIDINGSWLVLDRLDGGDSGALLLPCRAGFVRLHHGLADAPPVPFDGDTATLEL